MLRHSFALKWFSILSAVWQPRIEGFTGEELRDLRERHGIDGLIRAVAGDCGLVIGAVSAGQEAR
jgi:hypothetical protein